MRCRFFSRTAMLFAGAFVAFSSFAAAHASAAPIETCPATALWLPASAPAPEGSVDVVLAADSPRAATSELEAYTDKGFFTAALPDVGLAPKPGNASNSDDPYAYRSPVLRVQFPSGAKIYETWLRSVTVTQGPEDWREAGPIRCFPDPGDPTHPRPIPKHAHLAAPITKQIPDPAFAPIVAVAAPGLERMDCRHPFIDAHPTKVDAPLYPVGGIDSPSGMAQILIVIDPNGKVVGTSVFRSSGSYRMDLSAQHAAAAATYLPPVAFCQGVYGRYIFQAAFQSS